MTSKCGRSEREVALQIRFTKKICHAKLIHFLVISLLPSILIFALTKSSTLNVRLFKIEEDGFAKSDESKLNVSL